MSGHDDLEDESPVTLHAKAADCTRIAKFVSGTTRNRLIEKIRDYLERAVELEKKQHRKK